jgi:hypothetical protein
MEECANQPVIYSDGIKRVSTGYPTSTLYFVQIEANEDNSKSEKIVSKMAIPTASLLLFCKEFINTFDNNKKLIDEAIKKQEKIFE